MSERRTKLWACVHLRICTCMAVYRTTHFAGHVRPCVALCVTECTVCVHMVGGLRMRLYTKPYVYSAAAPLQRGTYVMAVSSRLMHL